jgi:integrase/recombinase XerD
VPVTLSTLLKSVDKKIANVKNAELIKDYHQWMSDSGHSESYRKNNLKVIVNFTESIGITTSLRDFNNTERVLLFLNSKTKTVEADADSKWVTTWNDYLSRLKCFFRWLYNWKLNKRSTMDTSNWYTPGFIQIKKKKNKRISPYLETEIWDREELQKIIQYEPNKRNKAIVALSWDLDARPHEITLLKIKDIKLRDKYGEGQISHEAKTGSGSVLLTISFPYVRDWLNEHPFKNEPGARLICNLITGSPIKPDTIWTVMMELRQRIIRLLETNQITQTEEREYLHVLIRTKKWNPYCIRHSAITYDADYLPGFAVNKKVRWSMNSRQPARYIKNRMGKNLKRTILAEYGIETDDDETLRIKQCMNNCPRCKFVNVLENNYCAQCSYPLSRSVYDEIKKEEESSLLARHVFRCNRSRDSGCIADKSRR